MVFKCFRAFSQVFHIFISSIPSVFFCMLQMLYLNVSKVDRVLYMVCAWEVVGSAGPLLECSLASPTR
jgi:hypothetical protein